MDEGKIIETKKELRMNHHRTGFRAYKTTLQAEERKVSICQGHRGSAVLGGEQSISHSSKITSLVLWFESQQLPLMEVQDRGCVER